MSRLEEMQRFANMMRRPKMVKLNVSGVGFLKLTMYSDGLWTFSKTLSRKVTSSMIASVWFSGERILMGQLSRRKTFKKLEHVRVHYVIDFGQMVKQA